MCGLTGFLVTGGPRGDDPQGILDAMTDRLSHRGPDDRGTWLDVPAGIALGHRRLAIVDLSPAGHQPMICATGRHVLVFNGEIYDHLSMREELERAGLAPQWRGHSDTETLLAGINAWGIEGALKRATGMFAFAIWDRQERVLTLARDRMGEKPLYYGWQGQVFLFGSELKALRAHPGFRGEIDREALTSYLQQGYVGAPHSIYRGIHKLLPGTLLRIGAGQPAGAVPAHETYWSLEEVASSAQQQLLQCSDAEALDALEAHLGRAVRQQSVADVPLGAFLSGGIDSSTVVAVMQAQSSQRVRTFTMGFREARYQEADYARAVAQHLGTDHTEFEVGPQEAMEVIPRLPALYDEPYGDSSAIPTYLVSRLARRQVTVALSGDGGDELFGGYTRYGRTEEIWRRLNRIPQGARHVVSSGVRALGACAPSPALRWKARRVAAYLRARTPAACYRVQLSQHDDAHAWVLDGRGAAGEIPEPSAFAGSGLRDLMMYADQKSYLPDDILTKVDRASMAVSLEARVPLLDHKLVEFAWRLPLEMKVRHGEGKWLLKQLLRRHLPAHLIERPKMGFGIPVAEWVRGPLREWAEDLLSSPSLQRGPLDQRRIREQWTRHLSGSTPAGDAVWHVLMFQAWLRENAAS